MNLAYLTRPAVLAGACALLTSPLAAQWSEGGKTPVPIAAASEPAEPASKSIVGDG